MKKMMNVLALAVVASAFACSSSKSKQDSDTSEEIPAVVASDDASKPVSDGGTSDPVVSNVDSSFPDTGSSAPTNQAECIALCESSHPVATATTTELNNSCFFGACASVCDNLGQGESKFPDEASAPACNTAAAGSFPIGTPSQACSNCLATTPTCCNLWIAVFGSVEGQSLSQCAHNCWANFDK